MDKKPKLIACNGRIVQESCAPNAPHKNAPANKAPTNKAEAITLDILARTLWGEARGEGAQGMQAVASVILNRLAHAQKRGHFWWGNTVIQICQKPYQFSCWNRADPNYQKLQAVTEKDADFAEAQKIARRALLDLLPDATAGATHYHAAGMTPYWVKNDRPTAVIGKHIFYKLV